MSYTKAFNVKFMARFLKRFLATILIIVALLSAFLIIFSGKADFLKPHGMEPRTLTIIKYLEQISCNSVRHKNGRFSADYNKISYPNDLNEKLEKYGTTGLVVIKNDSLVFEKYWDGYSDSSLSGSFSVAKSITSLLIGAAIKEDKIKSVDQKVGDFLPEFKEGIAGRLTIKHLLTMSSGSNWDESYSNPFSITTEAYYGYDLYKTATGIKIKKSRALIMSIYPAIRSCWD